MADHPRPDDLAQLRAELAAQRVITDAQGAEIARLKHHRRAPRRALPIILAIFLVALVPLVTLAANPFTDLNPGSPHNSNIDLIYNAGITTGCVPNAEYCPSGNVTREEMASFLARTAGLGTNPPVVNAKTAQTAQSAVTAQTATNATNAVNATNATNANTVGGFAPSGLVRVARVQIGGGTLSSSNKIFGPELRIEAPAAGFVLVTGSVLVQGTSSGCPCVTTMWVRHIQSNTLSPDSGPTVAASAFDYAPAAFGWVFPVAAGTNTFNIQAVTNTGSPTINTGHLAALYVPFGSGGAGALGTDQPEPQPGDGKPKP